MTVAAAVPASSNRHLGRSHLRHSYPALIDDAPNSEGVVYNQNWAGGVLSGSNFKSVTANVIIGPATTPSGARPGVEYATTTWVGIDGTGCSTQALLQTGVDSYVNNGVVRYDAWYEWYPGDSISYGNIPIKLGDEIRMNVTAYSTTSGIAIIENLTTGKLVNHTFSNAQRLCFQSAEWVVEDFGAIGSQVNFANFTTVTFSKALAIKSDGTKVDASGAEIYGIRQNGHIYTNCSVASSSSVTCNYV
jgi:hypothetical protein